jgi:hypothetical protein
VTTEKYLRLFTEEIKMALLLSTFEKKANTLLGEMTEQSAQQQEVLNKLTERIQTLIVWRSQGEARDEMPNCQRTLNIFKAHLKLQMHLCDLLEDTISELEDDS